MILTAGFTNSWALHTSRRFMLPWFKNFTGGETTSKRMNNYNCSIFLHTVTGNSTV